MNTKFTFEVLALAGITAGLVVTSGCKTAYSDSNDLSLRSQPESLQPPTTGEVTYAKPETEKPLPYWQQNPEAVAALDNVAAAKTTGKYGYYTVKSGDSLSKIAAAHGLRTADLAAANPGLNANKIRAGQTIVLPAGTKAVAVPATKSAGKAPVASAGATYVVKKGDILGRIANSHGVKVADLKKANNLTSDKITVGQKLVIPGKKAPAATTAVKPAVNPVKVNKDASTKPAENKPAKPDEKKNDGAKAPADDQLEKITPPDVGSITPPAIDVKQPKITPPAAPAGVSHVVKKGEDLFDIAVRWGIGADEIKAANNLTSDEIHEGLVLRIPVAAPKAQ